jgi:hypothetical protein
VETCRTTPNDTIGVHNDMTRIEIKPADKRMLQNDNNLGFVWITLSSPWAHTQLKLLYYCSTSTGSHGWNRSSYSRLLIAGRQSAAFDDVRTYNWL